ncbi:MAG: stage II sporulation protein M [Planctomycetaceae bacterium]|nr:stage II sporulation protein M [Planctomycetaceae bacterium]
MTKQRFLQQRRVAWSRFEQLLTQQSTAWRQASSAEIAEFSRLFRELSNDLAVIQSRDWGQGLVTYLNDLVARGHNVLYRAAPGGWSQFVLFLTTGFPRLFRANSGYFIVAALLFFGPLGITWAVVQNDSTVALRIVPAEQLDQFDQMYASDEKTSEDAADAGSSDSVETGFEEQRAAMAGFYVQHNVGIALQCFARGLLLGIGTIYTLLFNGIVIGGIAGYVLSLGHSEKFLSFVVSHGSFELTAIAVAGGAGLMLGDAALHPGNRTRLEALRVRGLEAVQLAGGAAVMLVIAALIEAFWSPAPIPAMVKYAVGGLLWCLVALYLLLSGGRR